MSRTEHDLAPAVRVFDARDDSYFNRGTVARVSPAGYVMVRWDHDNVACLDEHFSPRCAAENLRLVTGDDALPRHDWDPWAETADCRCLQCGAPPTPENYATGCRGPLGVESTEATP